MNRISRLAGMAIAASAAIVVTSRGGLVVDGSSAQPPAPGIADLFTRWTDILNGPKMSFDADVPLGSSGMRSLNIPWVGGGVNNGGHLYKQLSPAIDDTLYVRYYIKYPTNGQYHHEGIWMGGYNPPL